MYGVRGIFAEYERTKIAERFRLGKVRKAKEGHIITGAAPYGYTLVTKREGKPGYYEIHRDEAAIVRRIFSFVADEGLTIRKLSRRLHELGITPQRVHEPYGPSAHCPSFSGTRRTLARRTSGPRMGWCRKSR
jgi:site-specific DNA recombinase